MTFLAVAGRWLLKFFSSLRLAVVLLSLSMVLVFFATLDQTNFGIHEVQKRYFQSFFVLWSPFPPEPGVSVRSFGLPLPGGYLLGGLLFINLIVGQFVRVRWSWKKSGIFLVHLGVVMLLLGEFFTGLLSEERQMWLDEGGTRNWAETFLENEMVVIDLSDPELDTVYAVDASRLNVAKPLSHPDWPFQIIPRQFFANALLRRVPPGEPLELQANSGVVPQMRLQAIGQEKTYAHNEINTVTAVVEIARDSGEPGTTWMVSNIFDERFPSQRFMAGGREWEIALRFKRTYYPFSVTLMEFRHDRYPGTEIPKNFSSQVIITHPDKGIEQPALIYMNHPLRYEGLTFYQASFANQDTSSMLQVVRNPSWQMPYMSLVVMSVGLTLQFSLSLAQGLRRSGSRKTVSPAA